ncbi:hypothetical protein AAFC00_005686 [Neodothiora populina]|uniref:RING-type domain-containing protein n=1 Tax=Neodothiora populina TaxID=2781224 RepID=A0ABR3P5S7_9PEZI
MDDELFAREVLRLAQGQTIEQYDSNLRHQARESGIALPPGKFNNHTINNNNNNNNNNNDISNNDNSSKPGSTATLLSQTRRSISSASQASRSTGLTSNVSRTSRDHDGGVVSPAPTPRNEKRKSATSMFVRDYEFLTSQQNSEEYRRLSLNLSPHVTPSPSTFSLPLSSSSPTQSSRESSPRRNIIRSLSKLRLHRTSRSNSSSKHEDECPHCPHDSSRHRRPSHTLPCGHKYCTRALRRVIRDADNASSSSSAVAASCHSCRQPIPSSIVERVMGQQHQAPAAPTHHSWRMRKTSYTRDDDAISLISHKGSTELETVTEGDRRPTSAAAAPTTSTTPNYAESMAVFEAERAAHNTERATMDYSEFRDMFAEQEAQRDGCIVLYTRARQEQNKTHDAAVAEAMRKHETQSKDLSEKHMLNLSQVEDKHVQDEMDLRATQEAEARNTATALHHMEAFCRGESSSSRERHHRIITEQDVRELAKTRHRAEDMDRKHEGEISVLRGEQTRRMSQRMHRQELEVQQLEKRQQKELDDLEGRKDEAIRALKEDLNEKKEWLMDWWKIKVEIWRKDIENATNGPPLFQGSFAPVSWPHDDELVDIVARASTAVIAEGRRNDEDEEDDLIHADMDMGTRHNKRRDTMHESSSSVREGVSATMAEDREEKKYVGNKGQPAFIPLPPPHQASSLASSSATQSTKREQVKGMSTSIALRSGGSPAAAVV